MHGPARRRGEGAAFRLQVLTVGLIDAACSEVRRPLAGAVRSGGIDKLPQAPTSGIPSVPISVLGFSILLDRS